MEQSILSHIEEKEERAEGLDEAFAVWSESQLFSYHC